MENKVDLLKSAAKNAYYIRLYMAAIEIFDGIDNVPVCIQRACNAEAKLLASRYVRIFGGAK
jgi:hypothetical protein